jgi:hypothetical protein
MDELVFVGYGMLWLAMAMGLYVGVATLLNQYYMYAYNMRNFPKTYLIRYMILSKSEVADSSSESGNEDSDSNADEESESENQESKNQEAEVQEAEVQEAEEQESEDQETSSESEDQEIEDQDSETLSDQNDYFNSGPEFLRVTFITCSPSDVVKKIKQSIKFDDEHEIFQLIGFEELC